MPMRWRLGSCLNTRKRSCVKITGKIIIVTGYLAAGKSTFALRMSKSLCVPYFVKDTFKSALCAGVAISGRAESSLFSAVTFDAMTYVAERLMETGNAFIIEGNFVPAGIKKTDEAGVLRALLAKHNYQPLTFMFTGNTRVLHRRFTERERLPERGRANIMFSDVSHKDFDAMCRALDGFSVGGQTILVDTTDFGKIDFDAQIETARQFVKRQVGCL